jgi:hypothetical protein
MTAGCYTQHLQVPTVPVKTLILIPKTICLHHAKRLLHIQTTEQKNSVYFMEIANYEQN